MAYKRFPYVASLKDLEEYLQALSWCYSNLRRGLWAYNYEKPYSIMFTLEDDYLLFLLRWA